jgi:hypothetical protein
LAWTDYRWAASYPLLVRSIQAEYGTSYRPIYFLGHWGLQYYGEQAGFIAWDARWETVPPGALVVFPKQIWRQPLDLRAANRLRPIRTLRVEPAPTLLSTLAQRSRIHFYFGGPGRVPWGFSDEPTEELLLLEVAISSPADPVQDQGTQ